MEHTITSREFNQDTGRAKRAAEDGPVFITDRGRPAHVLLSIRDYRKLAGKQPKIADLLALAAEDDMDLELPRRDAHVRAADFD